MGEFGNWPSLDEAADTSAVRDEASVLFVCTGNIARSASADVISRARFGDLALRYSSAGIGAVVGHGLASDVVTAVDALGIDPGQHRARQLTRAMLDEAGLVLALDLTHRQWILDEWPDLVTRVALLAEAAEVAARDDVRDEVRADDARNDERAVDVRAVDESSVASSHSRARDAVSVAEQLVAQCTHDRRFEIVDPFRRGTAAGEAAVARIEQALAVLLPWYARRLG